MGNLLGFGSDRAESAGRVAKIPRHQVMTEFRAISSHLEAPGGVAISPASRRAVTAPTARNPHDRVLLHTLARHKKDAALTLAWRHAIGAGFALPRGAGVNTGVPCRHAIPAVGVPARVCFHSNWPAFLRFLSEHPGDEGAAVGRVVGEVLPVPAVVAARPGGQVRGREDAKGEPAERPRRHRPTGPLEDLAEIVGT